MLSEFRMIGYIFLDCITAYRTRLGHSGSKTENLLRSQRDDW